MLAPLDLTEYRDYIKGLAEKKDPLTFYNSGAAHAAIVMSTIFKHSQEKIRIFAGCFDGNVSKDIDYLDSLDNFLSRKGSIQILLQEFNRANNPRLFEILAFHQYFDESRVKIATTTNKAISAKTQSEVHFTTGDSTMYRLEEDTSNYLASGSFHDPDYATELIRNFDLALNKTPNFINLNL